MQLLKKNKKVIAVTRNINLIETQLFIRNLAQYQRENIIVCSMQDLFRKEFINIVQLKKYGVDFIVNLSGKTYGKKKTLIKDNIDSLNKIITLVKTYKQLWPQMIFVNFGSITEYSIFKSKSNYTKVKIKAKEILKKSGVCDFHIITGFVFNKSSRIVKDLKHYRGLLSKFPRVLYGFNVSVIELDTLVKKLICLLYVSECYFSSSKLKITKEIFIVGEKWNIYKLLKKSYPDWDLKLNYKIKFEGFTILVIMIFLKTFSFGDPVKKRIAFFFLLGFLKNFSLQKRINHYEILVNDRYMNLKDNKDFGIANNDSKIFIY